MKRPAHPQAAARSAGRAMPRPLDLIHTNNSPKPVSMRVSGGLSIEKLREVSMRPWRKVLAGPLGYLLIRRIYAE